MNRFDAAFGWNEINAPANISSQADVLAARPQFKIVVRRIRGACPSSFELRTNGTKIGPTFESGTAIDIPGLDLQTEVNHKLTIFGTGVTTANLTIQYAYVYQPYPGPDQVN